MVSGMLRCWIRVHLVFLKPAAALVVALIAGCASTPNFDAMDEAFNRQVLFTVADNEVADLTPDAPEQPASQVTSIIEIHDLKMVAQWSVKALGVEAIVAEFKKDRPIEEVMSALKADGRVESVQPVNTYDLLSYNDPYFHLQSTVPGPDLEVVHGSVTGRNVTVGVVDTGVDREHPELADRIVYSRNFVNHDQQDFDRDEHGTSVAGVIASAANNELGIVGVAPESKLLIFKACAQDDLSRRASCDSFSLMKALVDVLQQKPDVLNLSLAGQDDPLLERLINAAMAKGIIVVAAVDHRNVGNRFPASIPGVIAVSSAFQFNFDWMPENGVLAPGSEVLTTTPGATYAFRSGSSMSTAFVAGIAALLKEKYPTLSSAELTQLLHQTAQDRINEVPLVDICHVVNGLDAANICETRSVLAGPLHHRTRTLPNL